MPAVLETANCGNEMGAAADERGRAQVPAVRLSWPPI